MRTGHENGASIAEIAKIVRPAALAAATFLAIGAPALHAVPRSARVSERAACLGGRGDAER